MRIQACAYKNCSLFSWRPQTGSSSRARVIILAARQGFRLGFVPIAQFYTDQHSKIDPPGYNEIFWADPKYRDSKEDGNEVSRDSSSPQRR